MRSIQVVREAFHENEALDVAVSRATLESVASGEMPEVFRLHVPAPIVAFGRADRPRPGYPNAVRAARAHGFAAVERLAGGRAAVFHESTLAFAWAIPDAEPRAHIRERFAEVSDIMATAFRRLGVDAQVGEIAGEYCPGQWSVNVGRKRKVMGVGQRLIREAAHVGGVVVVGQGERIRDVLVPVYRALQLDWDPRTTGALTDQAPGLDTRRVSEAILFEMAKRFHLEPATLPPDLIARGRSLLSEHLPNVA